MTLLQMFNRYLDDVKLYNSLGTYHFTKDNERAIYRYFNKSLHHSSITEEAIKEYIKECQNKKLTNNTINKRISLLKRVYKFNKVECKFSDIRKLKEKFVTYGVINTDNLEDILMLVNTTMKLRDKVVFYILLDTGCRLTELQNIKIANIDFDTRSIYLEHTKTNQVRTVFFTKKTKALLKRFCKNSSRKYLFINSKSGNKLTPSGFEQIFKRFRQKHGIKKLSPHMLRHTFSTILYDNGADLIFISRVLGHSSVETTKRYIHQDNAKILKIYDKYMKKKESK